MNNEDNFKIFYYIKRLIKYYDKILINFPHKELELKKILVNELHLILKLSYLANESKNDIRYNYQCEMVASIKFVCFITDECEEKCIISKKQYLLIGENLNNILKYLKGWMKSCLKKV